MAAMIALTLLSYTDPIQVHFVCLKWAPMTHSYHTEMAGLAIETCGI